MSLTSSGRVRIHMIDGKDSKTIPLTTFFIKTHLPLTRKRQCPTWHTNSREIHVQFPNAFPRHDDVTCWIISKTIKFKNAILEIAFWAMMNFQIRFFFRQALPPMFSEFQ